MLQWVSGENVNPNILSLNPQGPGNPDINCGVLVVEDHHHIDRKIFLSASNCDTKRPYICEKGTEMIHFESIYIFSILSYLFIYIFIPSDPLSPIIVGTIAPPTNAPSINTSKSTG